jgi:hypothetical protein
VRWRRARRDVMMRAGMMRGGARPNLSSAGTDRIKTGGEPCLRRGVPTDRQRGRQPRRALHRRRADPDVRPQRRPRGARHDLPRRRGRDRAVRGARNGIPKLRAYRNGVLRFHGTSPRSTSSSRRARSSTSSSAARSCACSATGRAGDGSPPRASPAPPRTPARSRRRSSTRTASGRASRRPGRSRRARPVTAPTSTRTSGRRSST